MVWVATVLVLVAVQLFFYGCIPYLKDLSNKHHNQKKILIIVIGPLTRSPRMLNHIKSFLGSGFEVEVVGQATNTEFDELKHIFKSHYNDEDENIHFNILKSYKTQKGKAGLIVKVLQQFKELLFILWKLRSCDYFLMQNPPSIPLLPLAIFSKLIFGWKVIIDWHNFGYSILALKFDNRNSVFVKAYYFIEIFLGKYADYHLTVTEKMKSLLLDTWNIRKNPFKSERISVLHDKPDSQFFPIDYSKKLDVLKDITEFAEEKKLLENIYEYKIGITSTSFTPDEDLNMLLQSLDTLDEQLEGVKKKLLLIITGKGPLKEEFVEKFHLKTNKMHSITVKFYYLKIEDYPKILQVADFGISLHYSSSGVDLPMKVLDMFGCGLPCLSYYYKTVVDELIIAGVTGDVFENKSQLSAHIYEMVNNDEKRLKMRSNVIKQIDNGDRWNDSWLKSFSRDLHIVRPR